MKLLYRVGGSTCKVFFGLDVVLGQLGLCGFRFGSIRKVRSTREP